MSNKNTAAPAASTKPANATPVAKIDNLQKELAERLQELNRKKKLADNRETFLVTDRELDAFQKDLQKQQKEGHFEAQTARIVFQGKGKDNYRLEDVFSISNVALICKFIENLRQEIRTKVQDIEAELVS